MHKLLIALAFLLAFRASVPASPIPLFIDQGDPLGIEGRVTNVGNVSARTIHEEFFEETMPNGEALRFVIRVSKVGDNSAKEVSGIVFVAPTPTDTFRSSKMRLAAALVRRLGCAVVSIAIDTPRTDYWARPRFYVYPESDYYKCVENALARIREEYGGDRIPVFSLGVAAGGVMSLYLTKSDVVQFDGVVAIAMSQDEDVAPGLYDVEVPTLVINDEGSLFNPRIARLHSQYVDRSAPIAFAIGRPIIPFLDSTPHFLREGGYYANELAYCFIRDAIEARSDGDWPGRWSKREIEIQGISESWTQTTFSSGEAFDTLYKLLAHNAYEVRESGEACFSASPPFLKRGAVVMVKKGLWTHEDRSRIGSLLIRSGMAFALVGLRGDDASSEYLASVLERVVETGLPTSLLVVADDDSEWSGRMAAAAGALPYFYARPAEKLSMPSSRETGGEIGFSRVRKPEAFSGASSMLFAEPTWIQLEELHEFVKWLGSSD
jgi:hypothetical protein